MLGRRIIYLACLVGSVIFYFAYQQWLAAFFLSVMVFLPLFSLLVSLPAMLTCRVELRLPAGVTQGTEVDLPLFYGSRLPTPPWKVRVLVRRPLTKEQWVMKDVQALPTQHCGTLEFSLRKARVYDYLGLIALPIRRGTPQRMTVYPKPIPMALTGLERTIPRAFRPKPGGGFAENHELRLYRPGDSIHQIHWKLSSKTGSLILREPMVPLRNKLLLQLDLNGSPEELDRKLGRLLWMGQQLLRRDLHFTVDTLTAQGIVSQSVTDDHSLSLAMDTLLSAAPCTGGTLRDRAQAVHWQAYIGGNANES